MGLHKQYLKVGQSAKNRLFGIKPTAKSQVSQQDSTSPLQMLISEQGKVNHRRLIVIAVGVFTLAIGIILSSIPWVDYLILKHLRLMNGSLSFHYWQKPGIVRLTRVYIFNVTNAEAFLNSGEKPKLVEVGPFVYREDMEKVNIVFHDNGTVSYSHKKILQFVPEMSADPTQKMTVPNIPLLTLASRSNSLLRVLQTLLSLMLRTMKNMTPFVHVTAEELLFGYDDTLVDLANKFLPRGQRPMKQMGLLLMRNGTLNEVSTIFTGHTSMTEFGYISRLNGMDHLPFWERAPCNDIRASEGSFFPPRRYTNKDIVHVYDKDLCRIMPLELRYTTSKDGVEVDYYTPPENIFDLPAVNPDNECFCPHSDGKCPAKGLQNIAPCQFDAPVYLSNAHFYQADPALLDAVEGLKPEKEKHESYFMISPKLGVPLEGQVRVQLNLKVERSPNIRAVAKFPNIIFPIVWVQEGMEDLTPNLKRLVYLATTVADTAVPVITYGCIVFGALILIVNFVRAYKNIVFTRENIERGKKTLRRGSSFIINGQHRLLIIRDSYTLLNNISTDPDPDQEQEEPDV
ncbi:scavenger receptor class B member 1 [Anabrus simplex]|uniref:scavenger receptor class B member 1 n=1 Tax=Anabrus simplex TaxID=316456 RepID=UPI0035A31CF2